MNGKQYFFLVGAIIVAGNVMAGAAPQGSPVAQSGSMNSNGIGQYYTPSCNQPPVVKPSVIAPSLLNYPQLETQVQQGAGMPMVVQGSDSSFQQEVVQSQSPVLVEFYATWCPHCQKMDSVLQNFSQQYHGNAKVVRIDIDKNPQVVNRYKVGPVPAFFVFNHGSVVDSIVGETDVSRLVAGMGKAM